MLTNYAVAPGEYLEEWMEDNNVSISRVSILLGYNEEQVDRLLNGTLLMTDEFAERLGEMTDTNAETWKSYERLYRSDLERLGLTP